MEFVAAIEPAGGPEPAAKRPATRRPAFGYEYETLQVDVHA